MRSFSTFVIDNNPVFPILACPTNRGITPFSRHLEILRVAPTPKSNCVVFFLAFDWSKALFFPQTLERDNPPFSVTKKKFLARTNPEPFPFGSNKRLDEFFRRFFPI